MENQEGVRIGTLHICMASHAKMADGEALATPFPVLTEGENA